ncbi:MAG TPA: bacterial transcriptional activator domain-containing protein [Longimicrobium sp.]|nr:bacterial transcriptional activator domain-containing protein [Longimicrobium sp.]
MYLRTLGHPFLVGAKASPDDALRKKDLALVVYLCVEGAQVHARGRLAALLWGESPDREARHSLTQALRRVRRVLPEGTLVVEKESVRWLGTLPCDAVELLRGGVEPADVDDAFSIYPDHFLEGFDAGPGAEAFAEWADGRRPTIRQAALRLLDRAAGQAAQEENWRRVLHLGQRAVQVDRVWEQGHRLVMTAMAASGERNAALRHYQEFEDWLRDDVGGEPDPGTRALAEQLRSQIADPAPRPRPVREEPAPPADPPTANAGPPRSPAADPPVDSLPPANEHDRPLRPPRWLAGRLGALVLALAILLTVVIWMMLRPPPPIDPIGHGETVRKRGDPRLYLAFAETLYAYPDMATLYACTGLRTPAVREVRRLPAWPRARLPSVRAHSWMGDTLPVVTDHPKVRPAYATVGCILAPAPDPPTLDSIFGPGSLGRLIEVPHSVLDGMPEAFAARGHPVRRAGTLIRAPDGSLRWITYHGGALAVVDSALLATWCRAPGDAVDVSAREFRYYRPFARLYPAPHDCRRAPDGAWIRDSPERVLKNLSPARRHPEGAAAQVLVDARYAAATESVVHHAVP